MPSSSPNNKARLAKMLPILDRTYPDAKCALVHQNPLQLLVATILSAQCTDERVNKVTPDLFARFPDAAALAAADVSELEKMIHSTGFFRAKAKSIQGASRLLVSRFGAKVPQSMEQLLTLPGVARKTANVVLGTAYGIAAGVVVDTHVKRLAGRLGLSKQEDPTKIEEDLMRLLPKSRWISFSHQLVLHGRQICQARKPRCKECSLAQLCPSAQVEN